MTATGLEGEGYLSELVGCVPLNSSDRGTINRVRELGASLEDSLAGRGSPEAAAAPAPEPPRGADGAVRAQAQCRPSSRQLSVAGIRKPRLRDGMHLAPGCTASKAQRWDLNSGRAGHSACPHPPTDGPASQVPSGRDPRVQPSL